MLCVVAIDALPESEASSEKFFEVQGNRIDTMLQFYETPQRIFDDTLTYEKAFTSYIELKIIKKK